MSDREHLTSLLDRLLADHDEILDAMRAGQAANGAASRLLKINARIHAAYQRLAALGPDHSVRAARAFRDLDELLA